MFIIIILNSKSVLSILGWCMQHAAADSWNDLEEFLLNTLDSRACIKSWTDSCNCLAPRYGSQVRAMKAAGQQLVRLFQKTGHGSHHLATEDRVKSYKKAMLCMTKYFSTLLRSHQNHLRKRLSTINQLFTLPTYLPS